MARSLRGVVQEECPEMLLCALRLLGDALWPLDPGAAREADADADALHASARWRARGT